MKWQHIFIFIFALAFLQRCARQTTPNGGPKDSIPPTLEKSTPPNNSKNFKGKIITLTFDEFIKLKDAKEVIITPNPGPGTKILAVGKNLTIEPRNPWLDTTTYSIAFREAVQDITESLPAKNLHLAFSTGPIIDSLTVSGKVHNAWKETIPEKVTVALYSSDTFNIFKHPASYFTETEKDGSFKIDNIKSGIYRLYAFSDKNKNLKVDSQSEPYGFIGDTIHVTKNKGKLNMSLLNMDTRKLKVSTVRHNIKYSTIKLSKYVMRYTIKADTSLTGTNTFAESQNEIYVYHQPALKDSTLIHLSTTDSLSQKLDTTLYIKTSPNKSVKDPFKTTLITPKINTSYNAFTSGVQFTLPLKKIRRDTAYLRLDSATIIPIYPEDITQDTIKKQASIYCPLTKAQITLLEESQPIAYFSKSYFISIDNDSSKRIKTELQIEKEENTGKLIVNVNTKEPSFIIQIISSDYKVIQESRDQKTTAFAHLQAGNYKVRAIIDTNKNGQWDMGNYLQHQEPEKIIYLQISPKTYDTPLRANWDSTAPLFRF